MDIQKKIDRLDDDHIAFRKKVSEYEWDYQDMRREANGYFLSVVTIPTLSLLMNCIS